MFLDYQSHSYDQKKMEQAASPDKPRLGFLGVGWIGRSRMEAILRSGAAEAAAVADPDSQLTEAALELAPEAAVGRNLDDLLALDLDGIVIATPTALHAEQSIAALSAGQAVFCQKPLGRDSRETAQVIDAARKADRLLGVDISYRYLTATRQIVERLRNREIGEVFAVDLVFHNAYGPDKSWYYNVAEAGGGCVIDLGIHLVDMVLWALGFPDVKRVSSRLYQSGKPVGTDRVVEDYAVARLDLATGVTANLACSWNLNAGCDVIIRADFYGTDGGLTLRNINDSYYDFIAEHHRRTDRERLCDPPDAWGGRAPVAWARQLAQDRRFHPQIEEMKQVADVLDAIYRQT